VVGIVSLRLAWWSGVGDLGERELGVLNDGEDGLEVCLVKDWKLALGDDLGSEPGCDLRWCDPALFGPLLLGV